MLSSFSRLSTRLEEGWNSSPFLGVETRLSLLSILSKPFSHTWRGSSLLGSIEVSSLNFSPSREMLKGLWYIESPMVMYCDNSFLKAACSNGHQQISLNQTSGCTGRRLQQAFI